MAISYPLNHPSTPPIKNLKLRMNTVVSINSSPFTGQQQVTVRPGQWWEADVTLPKMERADAEEWLAFLISLNGPEGYFYLGDPTATAPRGTGNGTPLINGASQTGQELITDGWDPSEEVLKAGDYVQIEDNLYKVLQDVTSDGSGNATLDLFPKIRTAHPDNQALTLSSPKGLFRLTDTVTSWDIDEASHFNITFTCREYLT